MTGPSHYLVTAEMLTDLATFYGERFEQPDADDLLAEAIPVEPSGFGLVWEPGSSPLVKPWSRDYRPSRRIPVRVTADNEHDIEWLWVKQ